MSMPLRPVPRRPVSMVVPLSHPHQQNLPITPSVTTCYHRGFNHVIPVGGFADQTSDVVRLLHMQQQAVLQQQVVLQQQAILQHQQRILFLQQHEVRKMANSFNTRFQPVQLATVLNERIHSDFEESSNRTRFSSCKSNRRKMLSFHT